nr:ribosomal protein L14 [Microheliella maris]
MITTHTNLVVADNSGAKKVQCIKILGGSNKKIATIGDIIIVSTKNVRANGRVKKGEVFKALIIRTSKRYYRLDGTNIKFDQNAVVLLNTSGNIIGTRIFGPVIRELRLKKQTRLLSLAPYIL